MRLNINNNTKALSSILKIFHVEMCQLYKS